MKKNLQDEIRSIVRDEISKILSLIVDNSETEKYLPTSNAWKELGYQNERQLRTDVETGLLRIGIEVQDRRTPDSQYARYYFDIEACLSRYKETPEQRAKEQQVDRHAG